MKFLIDMGVGKKVEEWFRQERYDVKSIRDLDIRLKDADILMLAASEDRMIITMDKDFGELVYNSGMSHSGVLILRLEDVNGDDNKILRVSGRKTANTGMKARFPALNGFRPLSSMPYALCHFPFSVSD
jgi:predicted nuclease of predicted toxin-antitoxin system